MITFQLNTVYEFIFTGLTVNNTLYYIKLFVLYGTKPDLIVSYNCPSNLPIEIINSKEIVYKLDSETFTSFALTEYGCTFVDENETLLLLLENENVNADKFIIEISINNELLFKGSLDIISVIFNKADKTLECNFKPQSYILNTTDTVVDGVINYEVLNINPNSMPIKLTDFINKIYQIINKDININLITDFNFISVNYNYFPAVVTNTNINEIYIDERMFGSYNGANFILNNVNNFGEMIKRLAFTLGCFTGFTSLNQVIFMPFLSNNKPVNVVNNSMVISYIIQGTKDVVSCLKILPSGIYSGNNTNIPGKYIANEIFNVFLQNTQYGYVRVGKFGFNNQIYELDNAVLKYWENYFMSKKYCFEHVFELVGINYKPYEDLLIFDKKFTPTELAININKFTTTVKAVCTG